MAVIKTAKTREEFEDLLKEVNYRIENQQRVFDKTQDKPEFAEAHSRAAKKIKELNIEKKKIEVQLQGMRQQVRKEVAKPIIRKVTKSLAQEFLTGIPGNTGWYFADRGNAPGNLKFYGPFEKKIVANVFCEIYNNNLEGTDVVFYGQEEADTAAKTEGFIFLYPDEADWILDGQQVGFDTIVGHIKIVAIPKAKPTKKPTRRIVRPKEKKPISKSFESAPTLEEKEIDKREERIKELQNIIDKKEQAYFKANAEYTDCLASQMHEDEYDEDEYFDDEEQQWEEEAAIDICSDKKQKRDRAKAEYEQTRQFRDEIYKLTEEISLSRQQAKQYQVESKFEKIRTFEDAIEAIRADIKIEKTPESILKQVELSERELHATRRLVMMVKEQYDKETSQGAVAYSVGELKFEYDRIQEDVYLLQQYMRESDEKYRTIDELQAQYIELKQELFIASVNRNSEEYMVAFEKVFSNPPPELKVLTDKKEELRRQAKRAKNKKSLSEIKKTIKLVDDGIARITNSAISKDLTKQQPTALKKLLHSDRISEKKGDTLYNYILRVAATYTKFKSNIIGLIKDLQHKSEEVKQQIKQKMSKEEWDDFKHGFAKKKRLSGAVFVKTPEDFIRNFDPAFGGTPRRPFFFHYDFVRDPDNVKKIHSYLSLYYTGQPVWRAVVDAGIDADSLSDSVAERLKEERVNAQGDSIMDSIANKLSEDPAQVRTMMEKKLDELIYKIFNTTGILDPEDRNYQYEDEIAFEEGRKTPVLFRTINQNFNGYITTSLRNNLLASKTSSPIRQINCPYRDCNGKVVIALGEALDAKERRTILSKWRRGELFVDEGGEPQLSKCDTCNRPIAGRFVNCPNCLSAVPLSSTIEAWFDYGLSVGDRANYKDDHDPAMEEFSRKYAKSINKIFDAHVNKNNNRNQAQSFLKEFFNYFKQLRRTYELNPDSEILVAKLEGANKIIEALNYISPDIEQGTIYDLKEFFYGKESQQEFENLLTSYLSRSRLSVLSLEDLVKMNKISSTLRRQKLSEIIEKLGENPFIKMPVSRIIKIAEGGRLTNLKYKTLDYNALRFDYDMQLVCPYCFFGINGEFNPAHLANVSLSRVANRKGDDETKVLNREELAKIEDKGILIGNTSGCDIDITSEFRGIPAECQPKYRVLVKRFRNAGFKVTNLANSPVFVGVQAKNKLYRGKSVTVGSNGTITFAKGIVYKLHCGIFFVQPKMFMPSKIDQAGREDLQDKADIDAFNERVDVQEDMVAKIDFSRMNKEEQDALKKRISDSQENQAIVNILLDAYSIRVYSDEDMTFYKYLNSFKDEGDRIEEQKRIEDIISDALDFVGADEDDRYKAADLNQEAFDFIIDRLVEEIIPDGANAYETKRAEFKKFMLDWIDLHLDKERSQLIKNKIEVDREKTDKGVLDRTEEVEEELERDVDERDAELRQRLEFTISAPKGERAEPLKDFIESAFHIYKEEDLANKQEIYKTYLPPAEPIKYQDFLNTHLIRNYKTIVAYEAILKVLSQIPESVSEGSTLAFSGPAVKPEGHRGKFKSHLEQVKDSLNKVLILKDDIDVDTDVEKMLEEKRKLGSLAQSVMEYSALMMLDTLQDNPEFLRSRLAVRKSNEDQIKYDKDVKVKDRERTPPAHALHISPMLGAVVVRNTHSVGKYQKFDYKIPISNSAVIVGVNILARVGEKENLIEGNEDKVATLRGSVYLSKELGIREGDLVDISVYIMSEGFFTFTASAIIGTVAKKIFGDDFKLTMPIFTGRAGGIEHFFFHDIIYKIGLDKRLQEVYNAIRAGENVAAHKKELETVGKRYHTVINRLNNISLQIVGEKKKFSEGGVQGNYIYTLNKIPPEKNEEFWAAVKNYIMGGKIAMQRGVMTYIEPRNFDQFEGALQNTFGLTGSGKEKFRAR